MTEKTWGPFTGSQITVMVTATILSLAVPGGLWAAVQFSNVQIYDNVSHQVARVTPQHALKVSDGSGPLTVNGSVIAVPTTPSKVVHGATVVTPEAGCKTVYKPPAGKAIVVMQITYTYGSGTQGTETFGGIFGPGCNDVYDQVDSVQKFGSESRTFPSGLPLAGVFATASGGDITVFVHGYLIPAASLPTAEAAPQVTGQIKAMSSR